MSHSEQFILKSIVIDDSAEFQWRHDPEYNICSERNCQMFFKWRERGHKNSFTKFQNFQQESRPLVSADAQS